MGTINVQFCGFGGQGIVLSSVVLGQAAVKGAGLNAIQTQSYGSESRGGQCQAEVILSPEPINSPVADQVDLLIGMSQTALDKYLPRLRSGGTLIIDPDLVTAPKRSDLKIVEVPASRIADELGSKLAANMVVLGFVQEATGLISGKDLEQSIAENVNKKFLETNIKAAKRGSALARELKVRVA